MYPIVKNVISPHQHGFMQGRSTLTNLMSVTQHLADEIDLGGQVDVIYLDISKAFDRIVHSILITKLEMLGVSQSLIFFFSSYLSDRKLVVSVNGYCSAEYTQTSGVPQGSNLGPLLFIIYINDIFDIINHSTSVMFADDNKIYKSISCDKDCSELQTDINKVVHWCRENGMELNTSKCLVVSYTRKTRPIVYTYEINETQLNRKTTVKDLGVVFDSKLSFNEHVNYVVNSALKTLGFIIRNTKQLRNITSIKCSYFSFVRTKLEFCALVWYPYYVCQIISLKKIQRRFLKFLYFLTHHVYPVRSFDQSKLLDEFEISSLNFRRIIAWITFLYKLLHGKIDAPHILSRISIHVPRSNLRFSIDFKLSQCRTNVGIKSPLNIICKNANLIGHQCDIYFDPLRLVLTVAKNHFPNTS